MKTSFFLSCQMEGEVEWDSSSFVSESVSRQRQEQNDGVMSLGRWGSGKTRFGLYSKFSESVWHADP